MLKNEEGLTLAAALELAEPGPGGIRLARSLPNGDYLAVQRAEGKPPYVKSVAGWRAASDCAPTLSWEPA